MPDNLLISANPEEANLVLKLSNDSEAAFTKIYDQYRPRVYNIALRYLKCGVQAEEVVQDVFMKLWLNRKELKMDAPVEAWIYTVAKNNTLNRLKKIATENKAKEYLGHRLTYEESTVYDRMKMADYNAMLQTALQSLSGNQLKVYLLAREENLSHVQIAAHLNISRLTVKTHMSRALQNLKLFFANRRYPVN